MLDMSGALGALLKLPLGGDEPQRQKGTGTYDPSGALAPVLAPTFDQSKKLSSTADKTGERKKNASPFVSVCTGKGKASLSTTDWNYPQRDSNPCLQDENLIS